MNPNVMENIHIGANCSPEEIEIYTAFFKKFCDVFSWSYEEILGVDPLIVEHETRTYPDTKPVRKNLILINSCKATAVKDEVEKLLKVGFIYPIALTEWVSNPIHVNKNHGDFTW